MPGSIKTQAVVLRSIRYGEADRIVHLYSATRGRIGAIAKGSRRPKSRFGGRLEPFFRLNLVLYEGRGDLLTVTGASTVAGHARLRADGGALMAAGRACDSMLRLFDDGEPNQPAYNLLCNYLSLLDADLETGVIDMYTGPDRDSMARFPTRVVALPDGSSAYTFTMFQGPDMPDELFESQYEWLQREFRNIEAMFRSG